MNNSAVDLEHFTSTLQALLRFEVMKAHGRSSLKDQDQGLAHMRSRPCRRQDDAAKTYRRSSKTPRPAGGCGGNEQITRRQTATCGLAAIAIIGLVFQVYKT